MSETKIIRATHEGELQIGETTIPVAVLEDGTRVLTQGGFLLAIGRSRTPKSGTGVNVAEMPTFLAANNLKPFISNELIVSTTPIKYLSLKGRELWGYSAQLFPQVCEVVVLLQSRAEMSGSTVLMVNDSTIPQPAKRNFYEKGTRTL